ncbi:MAG: aldehyde dehydrogenase family protein, partial [Ilumatobacter sp.]|nr:aldehyde dehydrogenase family protein [Ilumatobacter sp.]
MSFPTTPELVALAEGALAACGAAPLAGGNHVTRTPITGAQLGGVADTVSPDDAAERAAEAFLRWRTVPAPVRGELVRRLGEQLRLHKADLARLVTLEAGKIESEALGEVQEMI